MSSRNTLNKLEYNMIIYIVSTFNGIVKAAYPSIDEALAAANDDDEIIVTHLINS